MIRFRGRAMRSDRPLVMAIVNRTPDSFYDRGATYAADEALAAAERAVADGADIIDVGGVKAGPGADVDVDEETRRVVPFVAQLRQRFPDVVISVDTWRREVGRLACEEGADLLNDTWAGADPGLAEVAAEYGAGYVCSHTGGAVPRTRPHRVHYPDVVADVIAEVTRRAEDMVRMGVPAEGLLVDPTHDFGKNTWHSLTLTRELGRLVDTGWPVLVALSNKDFIGETLDRAVGERLPGTLAATAVCAWQGAAVFRAHNVAETCQALDVVSAIRGDKPPARVIRGLA
ncbi:dihydropteroate synthase [Prauserella flava]|uniref:Dihydropteroate synthase n=2 Tax=Prauserella salsuginis group TaxID=2893672 RepID=A0A839XMP2_9PSEU|nr:dihydropteroate synthase [Prauserella sediminis]MCR3718611.1 dihydropteroate synthase [Prauserella flava]MCR3733181.1 dihydropteroate synthase [Prauserella salsuginis]